MAYLYGTIPAICPDGKTRNAQITGHADTAFTIPARIKYRGKTVTGFVTPADGMAFMQEHEKRYAFYPNRFGKHGAIFDTNKRRLWSVTFEVVTEESAEHGDAERRGYVLQNASLRDAIGELFNTEGSLPSREGIEADCYPLHGVRWITVSNSVDEFGEWESRSLHFPEHITEASRLRLCRLLGVYGT